GARRMVETGVAYGWSSLALLAASEDRPDSRLVSVDMPYPKMNNEAFVGIVVPERFHARWKLVRKPDRNGLRALRDRRIRWQIQRRTAQARRAPRIAMTARGEGA
ncbi:MAG: hypothetical protein ACK5JM_13735, partial [Rhodoblastus sp.]